MMSKMTVFNVVGYLIDGLQLKTLTLEDDILNTVYSELGMDILMHGLTKISLY